MSRSTQYVGLTHAAQEYVKDFKLSKKRNFTTGMFEEKVPLRVWEHPEKGLVWEKVQEVPWSSGPMIFTCLAWDFGNSVDANGKTIRDLSCTMFEWIHNPAVKDVECDPATGQLWV